MTAEELYIKISADATAFRAAIYGANTEIEKFRDKAVRAGEEVTAAFAGLIGTEITTRSSEPESVGFGAAIRVADTGNVLPYRGAIPDRINTAMLFAEERGQSMSPGSEGFAAYYERTSEAGRAVNVPTMQQQRPLTGGDGTPDTAQPFSITTTVELDGDKIGEAVNSYFIRRNRITNGIED